MPEDEEEKSRFFKGSEEEESEKAPREAEAEPERKEKPDLKQRIYQIEGVLKTLDRRREDGDIDEEEHAKRTKKLRRELAGLYERKLEREIGS